MVLFSSPTMRESILQEAHGAAFWTWMNTEDKEENTSELFLARNGSRYSNTFEDMPEMSAKMNQRSDQTSNVVTIAAVHAAKPENTC